MKVTEVTEVVEPIAYDLHDAQQRIEAFKLIKMLESCPDTVQSKNGGGKK